MRVTTQLVRNALSAAALACLSLCANAQTPTPSTPSVVVPTPTPTPAPTPGAPPPANPPETQTPATTPAVPNATHGQASSDGKVVLSNVAPLTPPLPDPHGVLVDQVVAVVNGDLVLESDLDEERRFEAFEPFSSPGGSARDKVIERLIDRTLILQQSKLQPDEGVPIEDVRKQLQSLRKDLPACRHYSCETDAGWAKFIAAQGFTEPELELRWQQRMQILRFIEMRFRSGIDITPAEIKTYYTDTMLPEYAKVNANPPKLEVISDRIQEVLLEQQVSALLSDWLKSLKAEGTVRVMRPGEVEP